MSEKRTKNHVVNALCLLNWKGSFSLFSKLGIEKIFLTCYDRITNWNWIISCLIQFLDTSSESRRIHVLQIWHKHSPIVINTANNDDDDDNDGHLKFDSTHRPFVILRQFPWNKTDNRFSLNICPLNIYHLRTSNLK